MLGIIFKMMKRAGKRQGRNKREGAARIKAPEPRGAFREMWLGDFEAWKGFSPHDSNSAGLVHCVSSTTAGPVHSEPHFTSPQP